MNLFEFILTEKEIRAEISNELVSIVIDPSASRLVGLVHGAHYKQVRGLASGRNMYFWDSFYATHQDMALALGIDYQLENRAHVWISGDATCLDFLDRQHGNYPNIPEIHRLMLSPKIFFDAGSHGYLCGPDMIEYLGQ